MTNKDYFDNIDHTDEFYLKYPFIDRDIKQPITDKIYKLLIKSKKISTNSLYIQQAMNLLLENYVEFHEVLKDVRDPWSVSINEFDLYKNLLARKLSNLFSSSYAYTEHTKKLYKMIKKGSPSFDELKKQYIEADLIILEEVRNYAQHTGLPIHNLKLNQDESPQIFVDKQILLENKDKNKGNIESCLNLQILVSQLIPLYIKKLWELHNTITINLKPYLVSSFSQIEDAIAEIKTISKVESLNCCDLIENKRSIVKTTLSMNIKHLFEHYSKENINLIEYLFAK